MKVILAAGGTAGHINPALATAGELRDRGHEILFVGTANKMEAKLVPEAGFNFESIEAAGFIRSMNFDALKHNLSALNMLPKAAKKARRIIKEFQPNVVVGFGGYVSAPVLRAAVEKHIPTAIHEQNAFPGVANKTLAPVVNAVMLSQPSAVKHMNIGHECHVTGLPIRGELLQTDRHQCRKMLGVDENQILVLSMGGSLGAKPVNDAMSTLIVEKCGDSRFSFIHSTGANDASVVEFLQNAGIDWKKQSNIDIREYITDMEVCMPAADIVICRAGASTLSELQALGKASILIPSPYVAENHQYYNARVLAEKGAATVIEEKNLSPQSLIEAFDAMVKDRVFEQMGAAAADGAIIDAKRRIADIIEKIGK